MKVFWLKLKITVTVEENLKLKFEENFLKNSQSVIKILVKFKKLMG